LKHLPTQHQKESRAIFYRYCAFFVFVFLALKCIEVHNKLSNNHSNFTVAYPAAQTCANTSKIRHFENIFCAILFQTQWH